MAGGNITRITGGKHSIETEEWIVYTDKFTAYAGKGSHFTADEGTIFGNPKEVDAGDYIKKGWWSSDFEGNQEILKAKIGDTVYFQVEMTKNFPESSLQDKQYTINFTLYEFVGNDWNLAVILLYPFLPPAGNYSVKHPKKEENNIIRYVNYDDRNKNGKMDSDEEDSKELFNKIKVKGKKAAIKFKLEDALISYFNEFSELKLFMTISYNDEIITLPAYEKLYLDIEAPLQKIPEIYVKLLNFQVLPEVTRALEEINASQQYIRGNDDKQSQKVNIDYFSVRIEKLPPRFGSINELYKYIMLNFLTLASGFRNFKFHGLAPEMMDWEINGNWKFVPYPKEDDKEYANDQVVKWAREVNHPIFYIEAGSTSLKAKPMIDNGAVIVSEFEEMCWLFTTINTKESKSQPFSGHRQFGIHLDEDGFYRVFTRALDRVWPDDATIGPLKANFNNMDATVKDYLTIADGTWTTYMENIAKKICEYGGETTIMNPKIIRTDFHKFLGKYHDIGVSHVGNIPQYKYNEK